MRQIYLAPILAMVCAFMPVGKVLGQSVVVSLDQPLQQVFRKNADAMINLLRPRDAAEASKYLYTINNADLQSEWLILRVQLDCISDTCMTIIARNSDGGMVPEFIVRAGRSLYLADAAYPLWGSDAWAPIVFEGEGGAALGVTRRGDHWVVDACAKCLEWPASTIAVSPASPPQPPRAQPEPMSFDEFRQQLGK